VNVKNRLARVWGCRSGRWGTWALL